MKLLSALFLLWHLAPVFAQTPSAAKADELLTKIRRNHIDASAVYHVRELPLVREDARFYFNEGILALLEPIEGRVTGALFVAVFFRVTLGFSRVREVMADVRAMELYGGAAL